MPSIILASVRCSGNITDDKNQKNMNEKVYPGIHEIRKRMSLISETSSDLNSKELAHFVSLCMI